MNTCKHCGKTDTEDKFYRNNICKECRNAKLREQRTKVCKACGTKYNSQSNDYCPDCYPVYRQAYNLTHTVRHRANKKNLEFDLSVGWLYDKLKKPCPKTGLDFVIGESTNFSNRHPMTPSVDKIDPSKGYTEDNCQVVCWWYNVSKQRFTDDEVLELCRAVVNQHS